MVDIVGDTECEDRCCYCHYFVGYLSCKPRISADCASEFMIPEITFHPNDHITDDYVFSIVIPSWNNLSFLKSCAERITRNSSFKLQLLVKSMKENNATL